MSVVNNVFTGNPTPHPQDVLPIWRITALGMSSHHSYPSTHCRLNWCCGPCVVLLVICNGTVLRGNHSRQQELSKSLCESGPLCMGCSSTPNGQDQIWAVGNTFIETAQGWARQRCRHLQWLCVLHFIRSTKYHLNVPQDDGYALLPSRKKLPLDGSLKSMLAVALVTRYSPNDPWLKIPIAKAKICLPGIVLCLDPTRSGHTKKGANRWVR